MVKTRSQSGEEVEKTEEEAMEELVNPQPQDPMAMVAMLLQQQQMEMKILREEARIRENESKAREDALMTELAKQKEEFTKALKGAIDGQHPQQPAGGATKSKRMDIPVLGAPRDVNLMDFRAWQKRFRGYCNVQKIFTEVNLEGRHTILEAALDPEWTKIWDSGQLGIKEKDDVEDILEKLYDYLREDRSPLLDRKDFFERQQLSGEDVGTYLAALKLIEETCGYEVATACKACDRDCGHSEKLQEERLRDRLICGLRSKEIQQKVLAVPFKDLTLKETLRICKAEESSRKTRKGLDGSGHDSHISRVGKSTYKKGKTENSLLTKSGQQLESPKSSCEQCGHETHERDVCPAVGKKCLKCGKDGHFARMCKEVSEAPCPQ